MTPGRLARRPVVLAALGVAVVAVIVVVLFVPLGRSEPTDGRGRRVAAVPEARTPDRPADVRRANRVRLSDLRGRPVLVNFWASWCIPCRDEFPQLVDAYARYRDDGLEILGIVHDDSADGARTFAADYGATWPILDDAEDVAWEDYLGIGVPQSYFIDRDGVVQAFSLGPFTGSGLAAQLATTSCPARAGRPTRAVRQRRPGLTARPAPRARVATPRARSATSGRRRARRRTRGRRTCRGAHRGASRGAHRRDASGRR